MLHLAALGFVVACPVVFKASAMFHPEPLSLFFSTLAITLAARMLVRRRYSLGAALGIGAALAAGQLVRAWTLWTVGVVLLVLVVALVVRRAERRAIGRALAVVAAAAVALALPWYAYQATQYSNPIFDRPTVEAPLWDRRPLGFYVSLGLPDVLTDPVRPSFSNRFAPVAYAEVWGDYFGVWHWNSSGGPPSQSEQRETVVQAVLGAPFTLLAIAGWLALLAFSIRRPVRRAGAAARDAAARRGARRSPLLRDRVPDDGRRHREGLVHAHRRSGLGRVLRVRVRRRHAALSAAARPARDRPRPRDRGEPALRARRRQPMSAVSAWEWRYLRGALAALAASSHSRSRVGSCTASSTRRRHRSRRPSAASPARSSSSSRPRPTRSPRAREDGWVATRVEGNGVHVAIARSTDEAERLVELYQSVAGELTGKLERRGKVVYIWEGVSSPTQRQTMYDCHYD